MKKDNWLFLGVFVAAVSVGCAARSSVATTDPLTADISSYSAIVIDMQNSLEDADERGDALRNLSLQVLNQVTATGLFSDVRMGDGAAEEAGVLLMRVNVTNLREVGSAARFIGGVFAGRAGTTMEIDLIDAQSGDVLESQEVTGQSGGAAISGGTGDALEQAANAVARWLSGDVAE